MADTERFFNPDGICDDCGKKGTLFKHWGHLVPPNKIGKFCGPCMQARDAYFQEHQKAKPLNQNKEEKDHGS